ncbi:predicted protein [Sparassis crispa]|uniref:Uncharacterized protein n=1 Tax=Sparassis crispa TaxID=139825 RepID=A0A401GFB7_9APHY|nr:predicted protein [Sparassis crispa]GBE80793.1 predicted protein [Sparassis crispa]
MAGQLSHCSTLVLPPSPPLTLLTATFSTPDFECELQPSLVSAAELSSSEVSLCESQRSLEQILDIRADVTLPAEASKTGTLSSLLHCSDPFRAPLSVCTPLSDIQSIDNTMLRPPHIAFTVPVQQASLDMSRGRTMRRQSPTDSCPRSDSRTGPSRHAGKSSAVLGLSPGTLSPSCTTPDPPQSRYSHRLRRMAPPPLRFVSVTNHLAITLTQSPSPPPLVCAPDTFDDVPLKTSGACSPSAALPNAVSGIAEGMFPTPISLEQPSSAEYREGASHAHQPSRAQHVVIPGATLALGPSVFVYQEQPPIYSRNLPSSREPPSVLFNEQPHLRSMIDSVLDSPVTSNLVPPPLQRAAWAALPPVTYEDPVRVESSPLLSPLVLDIRQALAIDNFMVRADRCAEAVAQAALSLGSSSMLRDPEGITKICDTLQADLESIQKALDDTPEQLDVINDNAEHNWQHKHWQIVSSLDRNLDLFYLFANQIRQRPPRIHRLASHVDKLHAYHLKFTDLERRLTLSHEKFRLLALRSRYVQEHSSARALADMERAHRREFREAWQAGRVRRKEMRDEIRHVRGVTQYRSGRAIAAHEPAIHGESADDLHGCMP